MHMWHFRFSWQYLLGYSTTYSLMEVDRRFRGTYLLCHQSDDWWWRHYIPLKRQSTSTRLHSTISQQAVSFMTESKSHGEWYLQERDMKEYWGLRKIISLANEVHVWISKDPNQSTLQLCQVRYEMFTLLATWVVEGFPPLISNCYVKRFHSPSPTP
jgi:hypothetical protein